VRRLLRDNSLSLVFFALFALAVAGNAFAGWHGYNDDALEHHQATLSLGRYLVSSEFGNEILENWQSEFLQFTLYILLTIWLVQRGSAESKQLDEVGVHGDEPRTLDWRGWAYSNSLVIVMAIVWIGSWFGQAVTGWSAYNSDEIVHHEAPLSLWQYLGTADFWSATLQNWQSEFLAVGTMVVFSIYLRQRGSPESKSVRAPHAKTGG